MLSRYDASGELFAGQYYDNETGLHYNFHRYYQADSGRYVSSDPLGQRGGVNYYLYANADSLNYIDNLGLQAIDYNSLCPYNKDETDICKKLEHEILQLIYRNKHMCNDIEVFGEHKGHGLKWRFAEQIGGRHPPGSQSWDTHQETIENQQKGLEDKINDWNKNKCGNKVGVGNEVLYNLPVSANDWANRFPPSADDWRGDLGAMEQTYPVVGEGMPEGNVGGISLPNGTIYIPPSAPVGLLIIGGGALIVKGGCGGGPHKAAFDGRQM